ncbi:kelch repeat-containing protein [Skeletonema marinoi]|uniref:Kelch repeat-containing protein n=1 Tax=Skeletonema marinoi TaxID=267567 RepID=A0AAD9DEE8_9STRA|nr:kelch repeat-containing protein [Skeletonema marinoi]
MSIRIFLAVAALLLSNHALITTTYAETDPWSYLSIRLPSTLSDMAITHATYGGTNSTRDGPADEMATADSESTAQDQTNLCIQSYSSQDTVPSMDGEFKTLADMPRERARHASVQVWTQQVCVIGGRDLTDTLVAEIDCYDPNTDYWTTIGKLPEEYMTSDCAAFAMGNSIYLIGVIVIDVSNLNDIKFIRGPSLGTKRGDIDVAVLDDELLEPLNKVEQLTIGSKTWIPVDALNEERGGKQLVTLKGKIYALGGEQRVDVDGIMKEELLDLVQTVDVLDTVEVLDPKQDVHGGKSEWRVSGVMPSSLVRFGASEWEWGLDGIIFVFGGQSSYDADCECFRSTDKVMVFDASRAFKNDESNSASTSLAVKDFAAYYHMTIFACAGLVWL